MTEKLKRTPLYETHVKLGAKMVPFAGWHMPLQYGKGILEEHHAVRRGAGMFDVSHMGEVDFLGPGALDAVQALVTADVGALPDGKAVYSIRQVRAAAPTESAAPAAPSDAAGPGGG